MVTEPVAIIENAKTNCSERFVDFLLSRRQSWIGARVFAVVVDIRRPSRFFLA